MLSSGTVYTVMGLVGLTVAHEVSNHRVYVFEAEGALPEFIVVRVDLDIPEESLCQALEGIGIATAVIHEALRQCGQ